MVALSALTIEIGALFELAMVTPASVSLKSYESPMSTTMLPLSSPVMVHSMSSVAPEKVMMVSPSTTATVWHSDPTS